MRYKTAMWSTSRRPNRGEVVFGAFGHHLPTRHRRGVVALAAPVVVLVLLLPSVFQVCAGNSIWQLAIVGNCRNQMESGPEWLVRLW